MCQGSVDIKFKLIRTEQDPTTCILALRLNSLQKKLKKVSMNASAEERQPDSLLSPAYERHASFNVIDPQNMQKLYQKQILNNQIEIDLLNEKLRRHKTFTYMIVHDVKHPTEALIKILAHITDVLSTDHMSAILALCD
jgi:hypothetical protein